MATERDFREAVLTAPDDDTPRVLYAGWCDRQPDEATRQRGRFIRAQIALANGGADPRDRYDLRYLSETLEQQYGPRWADVVGRLAEDFAFDRGFVERIALPARRFLQLAADLFATEPIRHLDLSSLDGAFDELLASRYLGALRSLSLARCGITDRQAAELAATPSLRSLRWLSLAYNPVGMEAARALAASRNLPQLRYVLFENNEVDPLERYSYDNGFVVDSWLPPDGRALEDEFGRIEWLHHAAASIEDSVPSRFRI